MVAAFGFEVTLLATLVGIAGAAVITVWDAGLRARPPRARATVVA